MTFKIVLSILFTLVAMYVCAMLMGGGHGTYLPAQIIFPFAMVVAGLMMEINIVAIIIACFQYPFCVWLVSSLEEERHKMIAVIALLGLHLVFACCAVQLSW